MRIAEQNWMQVESSLARDDRAVVALGCVEQHAHLSLATDAILAERVAAEAAEPLGVPVFPVVAYGHTPDFISYPGTVSLRFTTFLALLQDILDSLAAQGFRRVLIVNGHGGNTPARAFVREWLGSHPESKVRWHDWWSAPKVMEQVKAIDPVASHASWMENFPWTRVAGVVSPKVAKPPVPYGDWTHLGPAAIRERLGDGSFGGLYERADDEMYAIWRVAVAETRAMLESGW